MCRAIRAALAVCLAACLGMCAEAGAITLNDNGTYYGPSHSDYIGKVDSWKTWWHDGGAPYGPLTTQANDDCNVFPDKNHDIPEFRKGLSSFDQLVAPVSVQNSYGRIVSSSTLNSWKTTPPSYGYVYGTTVLDDCLDLVGAPEGLWGPATVGRPFDLHGDAGSGHGTGPSGVVFTDVATRMLVQFLSCDKNDGYLQILVNGTPITADNGINTWCQGWWYLEISGMPAGHANTVELRTAWDSARGVPIGVPQLNTLDLDNTSENWWHLMPGNPSYPVPDDVHLFFVAYDPVPEPASAALLALGGLAAAWLRRKRRN